MVRRLALIAALLFSLSAFAAPDTTTINFTVTLPSAAPATSGTVKATLSAAGEAPDQPSGTAIVISSVTATIAANGAVSISLVPNDIITPSDTFYTFHYDVRSPTSASWNEKRRVVTSPDPATIADAPLVESPPGTSAPIAQIQDEGTALTKRTKLNFVGSGVSCVDGAANSRTDCTITSGGGGGSPGGSDQEVQVNASSAFGTAPGFTANTTTGAVATKIINSERIASKHATAGDGLALSTAYTGWVAALTTAGRVKFEGGADGTVRYYRFPDTLTVLPSNIELVGDGNAVLAWTTGAKTNGTSGLNIPGNTSGVRITGLRFEPGVTVPTAGVDQGTVGAGSYIVIGTAADTTVASDVRIDHNVFGVGRYGAAGTSGQSMGISGSVSRVYIENNSFERASANITVTAGHATNAFVMQDIHINNNSFYYTEASNAAGGNGDMIMFGTGVVGSYPTNVSTIRRVEITGNTAYNGHGFATFDTPIHSVVVSNNTAIGDAMDGGIHFTPHVSPIPLGLFSSNLAITGNVMVGDTTPYSGGTPSSSAGIFVYYAKGVQVTGNQIYNSGISFSQVDSVSAVGNTVDFDRTTPGSNDECVAIQAGAGVLIADTVCRNSDSAGVELFASGGQVNTGVNVSNLTLIDTNATTALAAGVWDNGSPVCSGCTVSGTRYYGLTNPAFGLLVTTSGWAQWGNQNAFDDLKFRVANGADVSGDLTMTTLYTPRSAALTCSSSALAGKTMVDSLTTGINVLTYCDSTGTTQRYAAWGDSSGNAAGLACTDCVDDSDVVGTITLDNITQITNRDIDNLSGQGDIDTAYVFDGVDADFETGTGDAFPRLLNDSSPDAADCDVSGEYGRISFDSDLDTNGSVVVCTSTGWKDIDDDGGAGGFTQFSLAADTGTPEVVNDTETVTITGGVGVDTAVSATNTVTATLDLTEANTATFGSGTFTTLAFDAGATDPTFTMASNSVTVTNAATFNFVDGSIASDDLGTVDVDDGGTGATTLTNGGILLGTGTGAIHALAVATNGQIPIGDGTTDPVLATITGTANEITVTNAAGSITVDIPTSPTLDAANITGIVTGGITNGTITPADIDVTGEAWDYGATTSLEVPNAAAPTVDAFGEIAGDNDLWAASRGAPIFYDGTASTALVNVLVSDAPTNGQVPQWNTGGTITWETPSGGSFSPTDAASDTTTFVVIAGDATGAQTPHTDSGLTYNSSTDMLTAGAVTTARTSTPTVALQDLEATDVEDNVRFTANCTATGTGAEDCDATIDQYVDGAVKNVITSVADGAGTIGSDQNTAWTITTDGTGNAELVVPAQSVSGAEILNDTVTATQVDETADYTFTTLSGKQDRNNTAVNDDDCTGEQGLWWYDTTDSAFEVCNANSGTPVTVGSGGASALDDLTDVVITAAATNDIVAYNGSNWVDTPGMAVTLTTEAAGDVIFYDGSNWINIQSTPTDDYVLTWSTELTPDGIIWAAAPAGGAANILDLGDDGGNDSTNLVEIAVTGDTNSIFTESAADKLLIAVANDWPKADTSDDLTCTNCIGATEISDLALGTDTSGNYVLDVADGTGIDGTASAEGATYTPTLDLTEINSTTFGSGTFTTLVFDAGATDPTFTMASDSVTVTNAATFNFVDGSITSNDLGTVDVDDGGTGATTLTDGGILIGAGTSAITALGVASNGQIPVGDGTTAPVLATITGTANEVTVTNGAGTITLDIPTSPTLDGTNFSGIPSSAITTEVRSMHWGAGSWSADGAGCTTPTELAMPTGGPKSYVMACADSDTARAYGNVRMPHGWDAGAVQFSVGAYNATSESLTCLVDITCQCVGDGEAANNTFTTEAAATEVSLVFTTLADQTQWAEQSGTNVCTGTCAADDILKWEFEVDATGSGATCATNVKFVDVRMEYTTTVGD